MYGALFDKRRTARPLLFLQRIAILRKNNFIRTDNGKIHFVIGKHLHCMGGSDPPSLYGYI